jgi:hypothetical protein
MALDIFVTDTHGSVEKSIPLYYEDYEVVMSLIEADSSFSILKRILEDYYGDGEIYLNELESLRAEIAAFKGQLKSHYPESVADFIGEFLSIVDYAIRNRKTIKSAGD